MVTSWRANTAGRQPPGQSVCCSPVCVTPPATVSTIALTPDGLTGAERVSPAGGRETGPDRGLARFFRQHHPNDSARPQGGGIRLELHAARHPS